MSTALPAPTAQPVAAVATAAVEPVATTQADALYATAPAAVPAEAAPTAEAAGSLPVLQILQLAAAAFTVVFGLLWLRTRSSDGR
jgi:hypothetical protein